MLVIDAGRAVEFDEPHNLLKNDDGFFTQMVQALGSHEHSRLMEIALKKFNSKQKIK